MKAKDGTIKFLLQLADNHVVETVGIPLDDANKQRLTVCVSSQVGVCHDRTPCFFLRPAVTVFTRVSRVWSRGRWALISDAGLCISEMKQGFHREGGTLHLLHMHLLYLQILGLSVSQNAAGCRLRGLLMSPRPGQPGW